MLSITTFLSLFCHFMCISKKMNNNYGKRNIDYEKDVDYSAYFEC